MDLKEHQIFKYRTVIAIASLENNLADLSPSFKNKIVTKFSEHESWFENIGALQLFSDCMKIFFFGTVRLFSWSTIKTLSKTYLL